MLLSSHLCPVVYKTGTTLALYLSVDIGKAAGVVSFCGHQRDLLARPKGPPGPPCRYALGGYGNAEVNAMADGDSVFVKDSEGHGSSPAAFKTVSSSSSPVLTIARQMRLD